MRLKFAAQNVVVILGEGFTYTAKEIEYDVDLPRLIDDVVRLTAEAPNQGFAQFMQSIQSGGTQ